MHQPVPERGKESDDQPEIQVNSTAWFLQVMRLRAAAEEELRGAEMEANIHGDASDSRRDSTGTPSEVAVGNYEGEGEGEEDITDKGIRDVWRAREKNIQHALDPSPPKFPPVPRPISASSIAYSGTVDMDRPPSSPDFSDVAHGGAGPRGGGRGSGDAAAKKSLEPGRVDAAGANVAGGTRARKKPDWKATWGADGVQVRMCPNLGSRVYSLVSTATWGADGVQVRMLLCVCSVKFHRFCWFRGFPHSISSFQQRRDIFARHTSCSLAHLSFSFGCAWVIHRLSWHTIYLLDFLSPLAGR